MIHAFHVGHVDEVLAGSGADKETIQGFLRTAHLSEKDGVGCSWAAIGITDLGAVWVMSGASKEELIEALENCGATDAEVMELTTLN